MSKEANGKRRVRPLLLFLLWIWVVCIALVLDLFLNVGELDAIRPRADSYRALRYVAHKLVGEPYLDQDEFTEVYPSRQRPAPSAESRDARIRELFAELAKVRALAGDRSFDGLCREASWGIYQQTRIAAMQSLARWFGPKARGVILERVHDDGETDHVRRKAARCLAATGEGARGALESLITSDIPRPVRQGAQEGLWQLKRVG